MIYDIRKSFKSKTTQTLVAIVVLAPLMALLTTLFFGQRGRGFAAGPWVAMVNGTSIDAKDFTQKVGKIESYIRNLRAEYKEAADFFIKHLGLEQDPKETALELLIQEALAEQLVMALNLHLHDQYVEKKIVEQLPDMLIEKDGSVNIELLKSFLERSKMTLADFESTVEKELKRQMALNLLAGTAYLPKFLVRQQFQQQYAGKKFAVIKLPLETALKEVKKTSLANEDIQAFFDEQNKARRYWEPEKRAGVAWRFTADTYGITVADKQIESYYQKNKQTMYLDTPAQVQVRRILLAVTPERDEQASYDKAKELRRQLAQDATLFAQLAQKHSDDRETAVQGGLMPFFGKGTHDESFDKAALLLQNDGGISGIIKTPDGIEILQRVARRQPTFKKLAAVHDEIHKTLLQEMFKVSFARDIKPFANDKKKLASFATKHGGVRQDIALQQKGTGELLSSLFSTSEDRADFRFDGDDAFFTILTEQQESKAAHLSDVKEQVVADLYAKKAHDLVKERLDAGKDIPLKMETATAIERMQARQKMIPGSSFVLTDWLSPRDSQSMEKAQSEKLPLMQMLQAENISDGSFDMEAHQDAQGGSLFVLVEREPIDEGLFKEKQAELRTTIARQFTQMMQGGFIAHLRKDATIKVNGDLFTAESNYSS